MHHDEGQSHDSTLAFWESRTRRKLTPEDAREIRQNAVGFLSLLKEWRARSVDADRERTESASRPSTTEATPEMKKARP